MYDASFHKKTLSRELRRSDFSEASKLIDEEVLNSVIEAAVRRAKDGFFDIQLSVSQLRKKAIYKVDELSDQLVLRKIGRNVRRLTGVKQSNRDSIIRSIRAILSEGVSYNVFKADIRDFYESVSVENLLDQLNGDAGFSRESLRILRSFFLALKEEDIVGLPRGIALSATLSEYVMRPFDRAALKIPSAYFYARFVDDILLITTDEVKPDEITSILRKSLPIGLVLNHSKTKCVKFNGAILKKSDDEKIENSFDYLGYRFSVCNRKKQNDGRISRNVYLDLAPKKVSRIKTRIVKSIEDYLAAKQFDLLLNRIQTLTGNYNIYDYEKGVRRNSGLYCNYRLMNAGRSEALPELDRFWRGIILSKLRGSLTPTERRRLLKVNFVSSYKSKTFYHFSPTKLAKLVRCWTYA